jgi:hypothetical protein
MNATIAIPLRRTSAARVAAKVAITVIVICVLVAPCWWQKRIMAGDLSSHIYNAWLATLIEQGRAPGLAIRPMITNVAFDITLESLLKIFGPDLAQRIAASAVVLIFCGGTFSFVAVTSRRRPWFLFPYVAALSYGWVFSMGFFNFLASTGFSFGAVAVIFRNRSARNILIALGLSAVAFIAHPVPLAVAILVMLYHDLARRIRPRWTFALLAGFVCTVAVLRYVLFRTHMGRWLSWETVSSSELLLLLIPAAIGADQFWTYTSRSYALVPLAIFAWGVLFWRLTKGASLVRILLCPAVQIVLLAAFSAFVVPMSFYPSSEGNGFTYILPRCTLFSAIAVLSMCARARLSAVHVINASIFAGLFFTEMYVTGQQLNAVEDSVNAAVMRIPSYVRVTAALPEAGRGVQVAHMIDRACVGRCFSYANYEAPSRNFRIHIISENQIVARNYAMAYALQNGAYKPSRGELGFYRLEWCRNKEILCSTYIGSSE